MIKYAPAKAGVVMANFVTTAHYVTTDTLCIRISANFVTMRIS